jgi:ABC-type transporter Mla subunit MlaD
MRLAKRGQAGSTIKAGVNANDEYHRLSLQSFQLATDMFGKSNEVLALTQHVNSCVEKMPEIKGKTAGEAHQSMCNSEVKTSDHVANQKKLIQSVTALLHVIDTAKTTAFQIQTLLSNTKAPVMSKAKIATAQTELKANIANLGEISHKLQEVLSSTQKDLQVTTATLNSIHLLIPQLKALPQDLVLDEPAVTNQPTPGLSRSKTL